MFFEIIFLIVFMVYLIADIKIEKQRRELIDDILNLEKKLIDEIKEKSEREFKLKNMLINAEQTKENYFETLEKVKRELL